MPSPGSPLINYPTKTLFPNSSTSRRDDAMSIYLLLDKSFMLQYTPLITIPMTVTKMAAQGLESGLFPQVRTTARNNKFERGCKIYVANTSYQIVLA